jgi:hypothetical protein
MVFCDARSGASNQASRNTQHLRIRQLSLSRPVAYTAATATCGRKGQEAHAEALMGKKEAAGRAASLSVDR